MACVACGGECRLNPLERFMDRIECWLLSRRTDLGFELAHPVARTLHKLWCWGAECLPWIAVRESWADAFLAVWKWASAKVSNAVTVR